MRFLQKFGMLSLGALLSGGVSAEALYWQVSDTGSPFNVARLHAVNVANPNGSLSTDANIQGATDNVVLGTYGDESVQITSLGLTQTDISDYGKSGYSFYVELVNYNSNPEQVTKGALWSYNDLSRYISTDFKETAMVSAGGFNMAAVPEPTSGLLMLMGGALLALRRRRRS